MKFSRDRLPQTGNCFVIMPFGQKVLSDDTPFNWDDHWKEVLEPTIKETGMDPIRADEIFGSKPLMDRIWNGIQEAELVIADLTGRSPNVLYELGLANVIGKRILLLTMDPGDVPADLAGLVQIRYSTTGREILQFTRDLRKNIEAARKEPINEVAFTLLSGRGTEPIHATVMSVSKDFATVLAEDGRRAFLNAEDYSWTRRRTDLTKLLREDQELDGAFVANVKGETRYSLVANQENPWPRLEKDFQENPKFQGVVKAHPAGIGAFVSVRYAIDGLVPETTIPLEVSLAVGTEVTCSVIRIDSEKREVELRLVDVVDKSGVDKDDDWGSYTSGQRFSGSIVHQRPDKGYMLVELPDGFTALLPVANMSATLRESFMAETLGSGDTIEVEIADVDEFKKRIRLKHVDVE